MCAVVFTLAIAGFGAQSARLISYCSGEPCSATSGIAEILITGVAAAGLTLLATVVVSRALGRRLPALAALVALTVGVLAGTPVEEGWYSECNSRWGWMSAGVAAASNTTRPARAPLAFSHSEVSLVGCA